MTHPLGEVFRHDDGRPGLRFERVFSHPPQRVWRALTESDQLRHWMPCDIVGPREEGAEVMAPFWDDVVEKHSIEDPVLTGRIITWDPPSRFVWQWDDEVLSFDLAPSEAGTRLTLTVRLGERSPGAALVGAGYHVCLDQLVDLVETGAPKPFIETDAERFVAQYEPLAARIGDV